MRNHKRRNVVHVGFKGGCCENRDTHSAEEFPVPARPHPITQGYHIPFGSSPSLRLAVFFLRPWRHGGSKQASNGASNGASKLHWGGGVTDIPLIMDTTQTYTLSTFPPDSDVTESNIQLWCGVTRVPKLVQEWEGKSRISVCVSFYMTFPVYSCMYI